jgi:hypothetical protein
MTQTPDGAFCPGASSPPGTNARATCAPFRMWQMAQSPRGDCTIVRRSGARYFVRSSLRVREQRRTRGGVAVAFAPGRALSATTRSTGSGAKLVTLPRRDSVLERRDRVKRERWGQTKRPRKTREQGSWIEAEKPAAEVSAAEKEPIAPGRFQVNSRHMPHAVKRQVWERDQRRCAFMSHRGRRCSERQWLEFHHLHAYALGGPATGDNIALFCRAHNAHEGVRVFGEPVKKFTRPRASSGSSQLGANGAATLPGASGESTRPGQVADQLASGQKVHRLVPGRTVTLPIPK